MEFNLLHIFTMLSVVATVVASHATITSQEAYWKSALPKTPMPKAIMELLNPEWMDKKSIRGTQVKVPSKQKRGTQVNEREKIVDANIIYGGGNRQYAKGETLVDVAQRRYGGGSNENYNAATITGKKLVGGNKRYGGGSNEDYNAATITGKKLVGGNKRYGGGSNEDYNAATITGKKLVGGNKRYGGGSNEDYKAATEDPLNDDLKVAPYFLEKDMHRGAYINVHFSKSASTSTFLPRQEAGLIPFSSNKLLEILNQFSVKPNSIEAEIMKTTINECEDVATKGEEKYCATSLESMIDFSTSKLGKKVQAISTEATKETQLQKYIINGVKKIAGDKSVVCHKQNYAYAVYYCHKILHTTPYMVSLVGDDGTKVKAVVVCHEDTTTWNPKHLAFKVLKVKPGSIPICHYLRMDTVVWVPY